jgi:hypothetical protein
MTGLASNPLLHPHEAWADRRISYPLIQGYGCFASFDGRRSTALETGEGL